MNYQRIYNELIKSAQVRGGVDGYKERHHIIPRSMGGSDEAENLVDLTAREHYLAHWLLWKIHGGTMTIAFDMMNKDKKHKVRIGSKTYSKLSKLASRRHAEMISGRTKENHSGVALQASKLTGRTKETHRGLAKLSEMYTGRTKATHAHVAAQAEKIRGRTKHNNASTAQMAISRSRWVVVTPWGQFNGTPDAVKSAPFKTSDRAITNFMQFSEDGKKIHVNAVRASKEGSPLYNRHDLIGQPYSVLGISRQRKAA